MPAVLLASRRRFFFSSRRRHTRCGRDWSSDVCSSDLRYSQFVNSLTGGGTLHFVSRGERAFVRLDSEDTNWKDFTGKIVVSGDTRFNPGYTGLGLRTGKTWNAGDFLGKDSTFADNVIVLENGGALYSESGERCYVIGELQGDESSVIHGYMRSSLLLASTGWWVA